MKKKVLTVALTAVLTLGCAVPAYAAGYPYHHEVAGHCFSGVAHCRAVAQDGILPAIQSLRDHVAAVAAAEAAAAEAAAQAAAEAAAAEAAAQAQAAAKQQAATQKNATPQTGTRSYGYGGGACGYYTDSNGDGICDYHGGGCWGTGAGSGNGNQGGTSSGSVNNGGYGNGSGYGYHHGGGHHGGRHH